MVHWKPDLPLPLCLALSSPGQGDSRNPWSFLDLLFKRRCGERAKTRCANWDWEQRHPGCQRCWGPVHCSTGPWGGGREDLWKPQYDWGQEKAVPGPCGSGWLSPDTVGPPHFKRLCALDSGITEVDCISWRWRGPTEYFVEHETPKSSYRPGDALHGVSYPNLRHPRVRLNLTEKKERKLSSMTWFLFPRLWTKIHAHPISMCGQSLYQSGSW